MNFPQKKKLDDKNLILKRFFLSLFILLFIRLGTLLPIPVIDQENISFYLQTHTLTKTFFTTFSTNTTFVIGLFTLNIFPYINASIMLQLLTNIFPSLSKLEKEGDLEGRRKIIKLTRFITLLLAIVQSFGISFYLKNILFEWNLILGLEIVLWLTTGAMIIVWLSELITEYGLGNGPSLLIYTNIVASLPNIIKNLLDQHFSFSYIIIIIMLFLIAIYGIIILQEGARIVPLISSRQLNQPTLNFTGFYGSNYIPLRFNQAGVMPIILTTAFLLLPNYLLTFLTLHFDFNFVIINEIFKKFLYWISYFILIIIFSSFYSTIVLNPKDISTQLQKMAVSIPGIRPGVYTTFYLERVTKRVTLFGSTILAILASLPNIAESIFNVSNLQGLGTTSLLILVGVVLDLSREIRSILLSNIYNDMLK